MQTTRSSSCFNVCAGEIVTHEEKGVVSNPGGGIAQAVAKVEGGRMPAFPETTECLQRFPPVLLSERYLHYSKVAEEAVQEGLWFHSKT